MKVIINRFLPLGRRYYAINICGVLFAKGPCDKYLLNHEKIHTEQIKELLVLGFYIWYVVEWAFKSLMYGSFYKGYRNISFEREAYDNGDDLDYLPRRRRFAFMRYLSL